MAQIAHMRLWVVLDNLLVWDHPAAQGMYLVVQALMDRETELEE